MAATIKIKNSSTANAKPTSSDLVQGELAINVTDKKIFTEDSGGNIVELGANFNGFKNRIINGAMMIDQRNAGASVTAGATDAYCLDRWKYGASQASKYTVQQSSTAPAGFTSSMLVTSSSAYSVAAGDFFRMVQQIEGYNVADLGWGAAGAQSVTLSFWVRSSLTGTFGGSVMNNAGNRSYPFTYSISSANTWEQKTVTIPGDTSGTWLTNNSAGVIVQFGLGVGSTYSGTAGAWAGALYVSATGATSVVGTNGATFYITGVQLEKGSTATSFDYRPYGTELQLCQRYYQIIRSGMALGNTTVQVIVNSGLFPSMRTTPSLSQQGVIEIGAGNADKTQSSVSTIFLNGSDNSVTYLLANFTGITVTAPYQFRLSANTNGVTASAEL